MMNGTDTEKLSDALRSLLAETQQLLQATAGNVEHKTAEVRERAERSSREADELLQQFEHGIIDRVQTATRAANDYVRAEPWKAVAISAGIGFVIGSLLKRR